MIEIIEGEFSTPMVHLTVAQVRELISEEMAKALSHAPQQERLLDAKEASKLLSVSEDWLYRNSKKLPFTRKLAPKMLRFSYQGIMKYLASRQTTKN
jgi:predicted DNA-binding transcriptional regulator AlpA